MLFRPVDPSFRPKESHNGNMKKCNLDFLVILFTQKIFVYVNKTIIWVIKNDIQYFCIDYDKDVNIIINTVTTLFMLLHNTFSVQSFSSSSFHE